MADPEKEENRVGYVFIEDQMAEGKGRAGYLASKSNATTIRDIF